MNKNTSPPYVLSITDSTPIVGLVNEIIQFACTLDSSDIHIDANEHDIVVRFRIDGVLQTICTLSKKTHNELIARIKILAGLKTDERVLPQDGRFKVHNSLDVRVSIVASYYGESAILRLLARESKTFSLHELGFSELDEVTIKQIIQAQSGLVLVTGPTGSGKTTTLYSLLEVINTNEVSIVTLEDPIEYAIKGIRQIQVREKKGLNFSNGLRSILRQDPDIIMVGEIRDEETAKMAVTAALTGHLVLTTLHANSAATSVVRLLQMHIEPYIVAATLKLVIHQRLVRKRCLNCENVSKVECSVCQNSGYKGRTVIAETLKISAPLQQLITERVSVFDFEKSAVQSGMKLIKDNGLEKVSQGITTLEEVLKVTYE